jgi:glycosyltransferase involved in cell wall biosynthesis
MCESDSGMVPEPRRVTLVADEMLGHVRTGGLGTATTFLALCLARMGHGVELLYIGERPTNPIDPDWARLYERTGVAIRLLPRGEARVEPSWFAQTHDVELALRGDPPDVVITQDLAAPAYAAVRLRHLGLAFEQTLFVVYCHGTRRWITDMAQKAGVLPGALAVSLLEQASLELADVVVSPSAYLVEWMRNQDWRLPARTEVIPYLTRSAATGEPTERAELGDGRIERLTFFGRLEERKGLEPFAAGLNRIEPQLLRKVELEFLGKATPAWPPQRVEGLLSDTTRESLRGITFETNLDQREALARFNRSGTLAIMPSLEDNSPNTVYECLERGIPFIASRLGGTAELIAPDDRERVLFEPTPAGVEAALRRVLSDGNALRPARPAFDANAAVAKWAGVIETQPSSQRRSEARPAVDVVVVQRERGNRTARSLEALERQSYENFSSVVETSRQAALRAGNAEWVVFLADDDLPDDDFLETLVLAQAASGADVVTCGIRLGSGAQHLFSGDPGGLGLISNGYGTVALIRRSLLSEPSLPLSSDWPLLARLSLGDAQVVSIPQAGLRSLARLAAGLAADSPAPARHRRRVRARLSGLLGRR